MGLEYGSLPRPSSLGAKWFLKGANLPSLRVSLAPLGRCWYVNGLSCMVNVGKDFIHGAYGLQTRSRR